jgi:eukaryotic-like serine/threonine-protein kinase
MCDVELPPGAPEGVCPACLLVRQLLEEIGGASSRDSGVRGDEAAPASATMPVHEAETKVIPPAPGDDALPDPSSAQAEQTIGPYRIVRPLGAGGMGAVFEARQERPVRRTVALKIIRPGTDTEQVIARFEAERQALAMMEHPNIAKVLDAGSTPAGQPYFVMELVEGVPFTSYCTKHRLDFRQRLELFVPVCHAIQHAHQKGVSHRDIKPSNVLVTTYDGRAVPKVIDFGLAKAIGQSLTDKTLYTEFGAVVGTLPYMSPEQAGSTPDIDTRTDVYALGVLLYELLTGSTPLTRDRLTEAALDEVLRRIREEEPPRPSQRLAESKESLTTISGDCRMEPARLVKLIRNDLDWVVMKALEKDRSRRYETASALAADVLRYLADEPVIARRPSRLHRLEKFVRRHRVAVFVAGLIVTSLAALAGVFFWSALELRRSLSVSNRRLAAIFYERGQAALDNDQIAPGLVLMAESWRWAAAGGDPIWQHTARANLSAWRRQIPRATLICRHSDQPVARVAFSRDGAVVLMKSASLTRVLVASTGNSYDGTFLEANPFIEGSSASQFVRPELNSNPDGTAIRVTPEGHALPKAGKGPAVYAKRWNAQLWSSIPGTPAGERAVRSQAIGCWSFGPDGKTLLTGGEEGRAQLWNTTDGSAIGVPMLHPRAVDSVAFSPNGKAVVTICADDAARLWDAFSGSSIGSPMAHPGPVRVVAFSPDGSTLLTGGADGVARFWDAANSSPLAISVFHPSAIDSVAFRPDGKAVIVGGADGTARVWELGTGGYTELQLGGNAGKPFAAFSPDGRTFFDGKFLRDTATGRPLSKGLPTSSTRLVAVSPDGTRAFTVTGMAHETCLWDLSTGKPVAPPMPQIRSGAFQPDGQKLVTTSFGNEFRWWDAKTGRPLGEPIGSQWGVEKLLFGPDPRFFVTMVNGMDDAFSLDGRSFTINLGSNLQVWDARTTQPVGMPLTYGRDSRPARFIALAFHPGGGLLLTSSEGGMYASGTSRPHHSAVRRCDTRAPCARWRSVRMERE